MQKTGVVCHTHKLKTKGFGFIDPVTGETSHDVGLQLLSGTVRADPRKDWGNAGAGNVFFHTLGKGNKNVKDLTHGQAVKYTEGRNAKGLFAEHIVPLAGVWRAYLCVRE